jgi:hypothetical protein
MSANQTAKHLTLEEREIIADSLSKDMNFKEIAILLSRHPSTISREIANHKEIVKKRISFTGQLNRDCLHVKNCSIRKLCKVCSQEKSDTKNARNAPILHVITDTVKDVLMRILFDIRENIQMLTSQKWTQ